MFIGHYGPAFAGKTVAKAVPLWAFFLAVQLVDVLWGIFIANGIEHVRIVPGFTEANAFDLYDMPITHSLPGALGWSVLAGLVWALLSPTRKKLGGLAILPVHTRVGAPAERIVVAARTGTRAPLRLLEGIAAADGAGKTNDLALRISAGTADLPQLFA